MIPVLTCKQSKITGTSLNLPHMWRRFKENCYKLRNQNF